MELDDVCSFCACAAPLDFWASHFSFVTILLKGIGSIRAATSHGHLVAPACYSVWEIHGCLP